MPRKTKRITQRNKADKLFSKLIRSRGKCEKCGNRHFLQTAHIISRKYGNTRHDSDNALCLCAKCHRWAHDNPYAFGMWVKEYKGEGIMNLCSQGKSADIWW